MLDPDDDEGFLAEEERFKTALHYTVGKLSQKAAEDRQQRELFRFANQPSQCMPANFSKPFIAALTEVTWDMMEHWAKDLEAFAKHAKRSVINADDVRLLARRSPALIASLEKAVESQTTVSEGVPAENEGRGKKETHTSDDAAGPSTITNDREDEPIDLVEDSRSSGDAKETSRIEDDDLDDIILALDEEEIMENRPKRKSEESAPTSAADDDDALWPPFEMPKPIADMKVTKDDIERRRSGARGGFSLASFDDRWWEDPVEEK